MSRCLSPLEKPHFALCSGQVPSLASFVLYEHRKNVLELFYPHIDPRDIDDSYNVEETERINSELVRGLACLEKDTRHVCRLLCGFTVQHNKLTSSPVYRQSCYFETQPTQTFALTALNCI